MDIEVGEFVRTKEGYIGTVQQINKENYNYLTVDVQKEVRRDGYYPLNYIYLKNEDIVKHSKDIIDLIEVGDYVNGKMVSRIKGDVPKSDIANEEDICYTDYNDEYGLWFGISEKNIETILTHEQYQANCYKVKGEKNVKRIS